MFCILSDQRPSDFGTPLPIPMSEILAYAQLFNYDLEVWEVELIVTFDKLKLNQMYKDMSKETKGAKSQ